MTLCPNPYPKKASICRPAYPPQRLELPVLPALHSPVCLAEVLSSKRKPNKPDTHRHYCLQTVYPNNRRCRYLQLQNVGKFYQRHLFSQRNIRATPVRLEPGYPTYCSNGKGKGLSIPIPNYIHRSAVWQQAVPYNRRCHNRGKDQTAKYRYTKTHGS